MKNIIEKADYYRENFQFCENWEEKYQYVIDLGKSLTPMPPEQQIAQNLVEGCLSQVWLVVDDRAGRMFVTAQSDAAIVRGLIALMSDLCQSQYFDDVARFDFERFFSDIGLADQLSPNRRNGLVAFYQRLQHFAQQYAKN